MALRKIRAKAHREEARDGCTCRGCRRCRDHGPMPGTRMVDRPDPDVDDVREALCRVIERFGNPGARQVLAKFGADRVSDLRGREYADVIKACEEYVDRVVHVTLRRSELEWADEAVRQRLATCIPSREETGRAAREKLREALDGQD